MTNDRVFEDMSKVREDQTSLHAAIERLERLMDIWCVGMMKGDRPLSAVLS